MDKNLFHRLKEMVSGWEEMDYIYWIQTDLALLLGTEIRKYIISVFLSFPQNLFDSYF
jgi:hypothetical protein